MRSFNFSNLVQLPRLNAQSCIALGSALCAAFDAHGSAAPAHVATAKGKLEASCRGLRRTYASRVPLSPEDADALRVVDAELDGCFSGLYSVLQGWTKVPATGAHAEKVTAAREVLMVIYPDGLKFTQLPFKEQWAESQTRLDLIDEHGIEKKLDLLGAKPFVDGIRVAHKNYGDLQGLTKAAAAETAMLELRTALDAFLGSVRAYVVKVAAIVDEDDKASVDLADTLLQPLREWVTRPPRIAADDPTAVDPMAPEAAVAPVMPAAPAAPVASLESTAPGMPGSSPFIDGRD